MRANAYKFHLTCVVFLLLANVAFAGENSTDTAGAKSAPGDEFFCDEKIRTFRIELAESALGDLNRNERAYARARMSDGKRVHTDVGIHLKGMGSFQPLTQKPSFTVKFDRFVAAEIFRLALRFS